MRWRKLGHIYVPNGRYDWAHSHASNPILEHLYGDTFRVYFSPRDTKNRSQIASILITINAKKLKVVEGSLNKVLSQGKIGRFDDSGVTVTGLIKHNGKRYLYYLGRNLGQTIPFRNAIGLAVADEASETFERYSEGPIIDRSCVDPISLSYPFLLWDGFKFRVWYGSCIEWRGYTISDYQFSLKYAESHDGIKWRRDGQIILACHFPYEDAISRPHVIYESGTYKMWYSKKKGKFYTLGYAESTDGIFWTRLDDKVGIDLSDEGWDSEMIEYPFIFDHSGMRYMLYNGNNYGKSGFGLAVLEQC